MSYILVVKTNWNFNLLTRNNQKVAEINQKMTHFQVVQSHFNNNCLRKIDNTQHLNINTSRSGNSIFVTKQTKFRVVEKVEFRKVYAG